MVKKYTDRVNDLVNNIDIMRDELREILTSTDENLTDIAKEIGITGETLSDFVRAQKRDLRLRTRWYIAIYIDKKTKKSEKI